MIRVWVAPVLLLFLLLATPAWGQSARADFVGAYVPPDDWGAAELRTLAGLGRIDAGSVFAVGPRSQAELLALLGSARAEGAGQREVGQRWAESWPLHSRDAGPSLAFRAQMGWHGDAGARLGGVTTRVEGGAWVYPGPIPLPRGDEGTVALSADVEWGRMHGTLTGRLVGSSASLGESHVGVRTGPVDLWVGRQRLAFGPGRFGGVVLSPVAPLDGGGLHTKRPFHLPGFLSGLGSIRGGFLLARMERSGTVRGPWFTAARVLLSPSHSVSIGLNRAALFGGDGNTESVTLGNIALMTLGVTSYLGKDSGFENQVASVDIWARTTIADIPLAGYLEFGLDDVGVRIWASPAVILGFEVPRVPRLGGLGLGVEHARFSHSGSGKPPWYRHGQLGEGWTDAGRLLAHPLGGHGSEWSVHLTHGPTGPLSHLRGRVYTRSRGDENLFAPDWQGRSLGGQVDLTVRALGPAWMRVRGAWEGGRAGWESWSADVGAGVAFRGTGAGGGAR